MKVVAFVVWACLLVLVLATCFWAGRVSAQEISPAISKAAWIAYTNRTVVTADGVLDCDDNMMVAWRYLQKQGIPATPHFCKRNGNGHTYLVVGEWAIDNTSPRPVSVAEVGCDDARP